MKADLTRRTFHHEHHYIATLQQQGRVPIDADWNEQGEIQQHHDEVQLADVIGPAGFPDGDSFRLEITPDGGDLRLYPGHAYVDGMVCENDADPVSVAIANASQLTPLTWTLDGVELRLGEWVLVSATGTTGRPYRITAMDATTLRLTLAVGGDNLQTLFGGANAAPQITRVVTYIVQTEFWQPDGTTWPPPPALPSLTAPAGTYLAYLDVWKRHVTAIEDSEIREVALGGPDTCTRVRTTWQLRLALAGAANAPVTCATAQLPAPIATGALSARALQPAADTPCVIQPTARYRSLENQLYRVEVHTGGPLNVATFKYSADNGSIATAWTDQQGIDLIVASTGKDAVTRFKIGDWVELIDDSHELAGNPGTLAQVTAVGADRINVNIGVDRTAFPLNPRIRKWDQQSANGTLLVQRPAGDGYLSLDSSGVQIRFEPGTYTTGDYWMIPARTITTDVEWPKSETGDALPQPPLGIQHHYAKLGVASWNGTKFTSLTDCRAQFPPLTDIHAHDIIMDPGPCDFPANVKTVQDAISELCSQQANACCELVIVPGDDVQSAIDDALQKNVANGIKGLHVCFAAGTHTLKTTVTVTAPKGGGDITLSGCGLASHVVAPGLGTALLVTGWTTAAVTDLTIIAGAPAPKPKPKPGQPQPINQGPKIPNGAVVLVDCDSSVVERASITCGAASKKLTHCIAIVTTTLPSTSAARVSDCDLTVGNRQIGIGLTSIDRSTIDNNRIDVLPLSNPDKAAYTTSPEYLGMLRSQLLSDLRIGTAAGKTVDTTDGTARNHVTIDNVKLAFTSDGAATPLWSTYSAAGGLSKLAGLQRTATLTDAVARDTKKKKTKKPAAPAPTPAAAETTVAEGRVPNNLASRVRTKLKHETTKILRHVSDAKATPQQLADAKLNGFAQWKQAQDAKVAAAMSDAIVIAGGHAGDVRVIDNAVSGASTGIRLAVKFEAAGPVAGTPEVSVRRARIAGNTVAFEVPTGAKGKHSGIYVGNCTSLVIEDNYARQRANAGSCVGVRVLGKLGKLMRAEGNQAINARIGIEIKPSNLQDKNVLWVLSQNVAETTQTPIVAPDPQVLKLNNVP